MVAEEQSWASDLGEDKGMRVARGELVGGCEEEAGNTDCKEMLRGGPVAHMPLRVWALLEAFPS